MTLLCALGYAANSGYSEETTQLKAFAIKAVALLRKHNNKLPKKHLCSDTRNHFKYQKFYKPNAESMALGDSASADSEAAKLSAVKRVQSCLLYTSPSPRDS